MNSIKYLPLLLFQSLFLSTLFCQEYKTTLLDTLSVRKDTVTFHNKVYFVCTINQKYRHAGKWDIYYDASFIKIAATCSFDEHLTQIGTEYQFHNNGKIKQKSVFVASRVLPEKIFYDEQGKLLFKSEYDLDTLKEYHFYENGNVSVIDYTLTDTVDYVLNYFSHTEYCENGNIIIHYNPCSLHENVTEFYCTGEKKKSYHLYASDYSGDYKEFYKDGTIKVAGQFTNYPKDEKLGEKVGKWIYYTESGEIEKEENY